MENGKILYRYTLKDGKFFIHEGVVNWCGFRPMVNFKDGAPTQRCPREEDLGKIRSVGRSLWLEERDDKKASKMFIAYELKKIDELKAKIERKKETVNMLWDSMEDV